MTESNPTPRQATGTGEQRPAALPKGILSGAAFLMAVSAIGPGFLSQTALFTAELGASLAFAILLSTVIDIGAQLNTWRVVCISGKRGHEVADAVVPGLGYVLVFVIVAGSFAFNVGNLGGCALGLQAVLGTDFTAGAAVSTAIAVGLFLLPGMLTAVDWFSKALGAGMILMTAWILLQSSPPYGEAALAAVAPAKINVSTIVTFVGGTIGGYIMFSGAHRLLDGGVTGAANAGAITRASVQGIIIAGVMRTVVFLAVLGVVAGGARLSKETPVFDAFRAGAGEVGYILSGLVFWAAAITSVVGCAYTSVSFLAGSAAPHIRARLIIGFTVSGFAVTIGLRALDWNATAVMVWAGKINGLFLPLLLGTILLAAYRRSVVGEYRHPWWAGAFGLLALLATAFMAAVTLRDMFFAAAK